VQHYDIGKQAPRNGKAVYEEALTKDVLQEIVHRAQPTTLSLNHPYTTEDRAKPVKDLVKDYKGTGIGRIGTRAFP